MGRHKKQKSSKSLNTNPPTSNLTTDATDATATEMMQVSEESLNQDTCSQRHIPRNESSDAVSSPVPEIVFRESEDENSSSRFDPERPDGDTVEDDTSGCLEKMDILGNGLVTKQVLEKGLGQETRPNHGDVVTICYQCWLESDGTCVEDIPELTFVLGDGDVIHAFDIALPLAELKEKFELVVDARFAFGSRGREPDIPSNAALRYRIQLLATDDPPQYNSMSGQERLALADQKREKGNYYFRREEYQPAVNSYLKALKILTLDPVDQEGDVTRGTLDSSSDCNHDIENLILKLHNNLAATQLKIQAYDAAIKSCDTVLLKEPHNYKALFRKGRALNGLGKTDEAIDVLKKVHEILPHSPMVVSELELARKMQQHERERWSRVARRLSPMGNNLKDKQSPRTLSNLRSIVCSRRVMFITGIVFALISIGLAWYTEQFARVSASWLTNKESS